MPPRGVALLLLYLNYGLTPPELIALQITDVSWDGKQDVLTLPTRRQPMPLRPVDASLLLRYTGLVKRLLPDNPLFTATKTIPQGARLTARTIQRPLTVAIHAANQQIQAQNALLPVKEHRPLLPFLTVAMLKKEIAIHCTTPPR